MGTHQPPTVAIVSAGAMGAGLAKRLTTSGCRVFTMLEGRSQGTKQRAAEAGMEIVSIKSIVRDARWVLSVLPPSSAEPFALEFLAAEKAEGRDPSRRSVFVDCNAKNPETARYLASLFEESPTTFLDASIVGLPPKDGHDPAIYASADPRDQHVLDEFSALEKFGLKIKLLKGYGTGVGDASALKMSYSGIMKGIVGMYEIMILSAYAHSPAVAKQLLKELNASQLLDTQNIAFYVPNSLSKAYRFVREMEEMKGFVGATVDASKAKQNRNVDDARGDVAQIYEGFASIYRRISDSVAGSGLVFKDGLSDVDVLLDAAKMASSLTSTKSI